MEPTPGHGRHLRKLVVIGLVLMAVTLGVVSVGVVSLTSVQTEFDTFAEKDFPGLNHLIHVDRDIFRAQRSLEKAFLANDEHSREEAIAEYEAQIARTNARWESYLGIAYESSAERELQVEYEQARAEWLEAGSSLVALARDGRVASSPEVLAGLEHAEEHFAPTRQAVHSLEEDFYEPLVEYRSDVGQFDARLVLLGLLGGGLALGAIVSLMAVRSLKHKDAELRERDLIEAQRLAELNSRFRSMVESVDDVITVVSGTDTLTVMSPDLRALGSVSQKPAPTTVAELLSEDQHEVWATADQRLQEQGIPSAIEIEATRQDGTSVFLEATGSNMTDGSEERAWVWRDITERKKLELELAHQAFHDSLTGVANRALLVDRADHALKRSSRTGTPISLLFCDLDEFKAVNDSLGHGLGDELLGIITKRLQGCIRESDTLSRFGGDEFAILLDDADIQGATALAERILSVVRYEVSLDGHPVFPSMSIGVATSMPGTTTEELIRDADIAMYRAKGAGKGRVEAFQDGMHDVATDLLEMQTDLKIAVENDQLDLFYQPTVALSTGVVQGVEALIRWHHPTRGDIPPDTFIPIAEATGQIIGIGRWVLTRACRTAVKLQEGRSTPLLMHVNLSPQQLRDPRIVAVTKTALEESGLAPELLVLEVTEGFLLDDAVSVGRLHELHALGVRIAIDDFGTGYTSIGYLQRLPVDILKIDRSFVSGDALEPTERKAFLNAMLGLAKSLNLETVAEGIEEPCQLDELRELGCETGQGWLWARAVSGDSLQGSIEELTIASFES